MVCKDSPARRLPKEIFHPGPRGRPRRPCGWPAKGPGQTCSVRQRSPRRGPYVRTAVADGFSGLADADLLLHCVGLQWLSGASRTRASVECGRRVVGDRSSDRVGPDTGGPWYEPWYEPWCARSAVRAGPVRAGFEGADPTADRRSSRAHVGVETCRGHVGRQGLARSTGTICPSGSSSPVSSKITTPLRSRPQPCSG
jgi:hypothetical protein